ncbi:MAG TPA: thioredoxin family protein [Chthoniobacterales bacterium]
MPTVATDSMPLGTIAPDFSLPDVASGELVSSANFAGSRAILVIFLCAHCPYVVHVRDEVVRIANEYLPKGVAIVGISANDAVKYPEDGPDGLRRMVVENAIPFPLLYDESQEVARAYTAACTPEFFLFDSARRLAYHGRLDESTPGNGLPVTGADLRAALEAVISESPVPQPQKPSLGCSIKWKG